MSCLVDFLFPLMTWVLDFYISSAVLLYVGSFVAGLPRRVYLWLSLVPSGEFVEGATSIPYRQYT